MKVYVCVIINVSVQTVCTNSAAFCLLFISPPVLHSVCLYYRGL